MKNLSYFVTKFKNTGWIEKAQVCITKPEEVNALLLKVKGYMTKEKLFEVKDFIQLMSCYVRDIVTCKYNGYNANSLIVIVAALIYLATPLDFIPDLIMGGLVDDVAVLTWVINEVKHELDCYNSWQVSNVKY